MSEENSSKLSVTLKAGPGYDAPWIVLRGDNVTEVSSLLDEVLNLGLGGQVASVARALHGDYAGTGTASPTQAVANVQQIAQPQVAGSPAPWDSPAAPAVASGPVCDHGPMVHRTGTGAKGPWGAWFCPAPKGDPTQHKPQWDPK